MSNVNHDFIERYQILYQKDPSSKVFAPLGEAYRKMGLLDEALAVCKTGVKKHPDFPSGHVALAKILIDLNKEEQAITHLSRATELSPENILAHSLLAESLLKLRRPKEALRSYKMVLFLNPNDRKANEAVKKLESLTADEFEAEVFSQISLKTVMKPLPKENLTLENKMREIERSISLADAYTVRNDNVKAIEILKLAVKQCGNHPELSHRLGMLTNKGISLSKKQMLPVQNFRAQKKAQLEKLLRRINQRRYVSHHF